MTDIAKAVYSIEIFWTFWKVKQIKYRCLEMATEKGVIVRLFCLKFISKQVELNYCMLSVSHSFGFFM